MGQPFESKQKFRQITIFEANLNLIFQKETDFNSGNVPKYKGYIVAQIKLFWKMHSQLTS